MCVRVCVSSSAGVSLEAMLNKNNKVYISCDIFFSSLYNVLLWKGKPSRNKSILKWMSFFQFHAHEINVRSHTALRAVSSSPPSLSSTSSSSSSLFKHYRAELGIKAFSRSFFSDRQKAVNNNSRMKFANAIEGTRSELLKNPSISSVVYLKFYKSVHSHAYTIPIHTTRSVFLRRVVTRLNCSNLF